MKEWKKLETIVVGDERFSHKKIDIEFTELYVLCTGLTNIGTVGSLLNVNINGQATNKGLDTQKSGTMHARQQECRWKFNGLLWESELHGICNGGGLYYNQGSQPIVPYMSNLNVGTGKVLELKTNIGYDLEAGTIEIWYR